MDCLLIKQASYKGKHYTPEEWSNHPEQLSKSRKKDEIKLECPDGCELGFRCGHMRKGVSVQPHFFHKCQDRKASCLYMKKYRHHKGGGESTEHMLAKNMIADMDVSFERTCIHPSCHNSAIIKPESLWTSDTEVRVNNKWLADVVYYGLDEEIKCVIEVKHKHAVDGAKRKWLLNQPFEYMEVSTNEDVSKTRYQIIDMKGDYYCMDSEFCECHTEKEQIDNYFVKWCLQQDLTKGFRYLYFRWGDDKCINGFDGDWYHCEKIYGYLFYTQEKDESLAEKFNSFPQLVQAMKDHKEREEYNKRWREMERLRLERKREQEAEKTRLRLEKEKAEQEERRREMETLRLTRLREQKEAEEHYLMQKYKREMERLRLKRKREQEAEEVRLRLEKEREELRMKRIIREQKFEKDWINSPINKYLLEKEPKYEYNCELQGKWKGIHLLLIAYAEPRKFMLIPHEKGHKDDIYHFIKVVRNNNSTDLHRSIDRFYYEDFYVKHSKLEEQQIHVERIVIEKFQQNKRY